jgi:hypothetical protein
MIEVEVKKKEDIVQFVINSNEEFIRSGIVEIPKKEFDECIKIKEEELGYESSSAEREAIFNYIFYKKCTLT